MSGRNRQKMTILSDETYKIASSMDNFSGWLRARLRLHDEGVDLVEMDLMKEHLKKKFKHLSAAIDYQLSKEDASEVWVQYNLRMNQSKLGDFE